jgi:hypothetical protein
MNLLVYLLKINNLLINQHLVIVPRFIKKLLDKRNLLILYKLVLSILYMDTHLENIYGQ